MSHFADPWNPQPEEIRAWAYDEEAEDPVQDFDLVLSWARHEAAYLELASDEACPKRLFFLQILYLIVGDAARSGFGSLPRAIVAGFVTRGDAYDHPDIRRWQERARALLVAREPRVDYQEWCAGGFVRADEAAKRGP